MILKNAKIVLENKIIENGWIEINNSIIKSINDGNCNIKDAIDIKGDWILPGFIDCHVHGGYGVDFETGTVEGFEKFAKLVGQEGITKYCQGCITNSDEDNTKYFTAFKEFMINSKIKEKSFCIGCHMEGPYISPARKGAHELALLKKPIIKDFENLNKLSGDNIKIVTYAPELDDGEFTKYLLKNNIIPSMGHSDIRSRDVEKYYKMGAKHVTHLFNGMSGVSQHEPGLASFALETDDVLAEVITDGIHIQPETLKLIYKVKTPDNICIITDAMNAKGMPDGEYKLGNLEVIKEGMKVSLKDSGLLAGAGATYDHNVRTMIKAIGEIKMTDLIKMTSINVAKQLGIFNKTGSITENKLADLVILDKKLFVKMTISEGNIIFRK